MHVLGVSSQSRGRNRGGGGRDALAPQDLVGVNVFPSMEEIVAYRKKFPATNPSQLLKELGLFEQKSHDEVFTRKACD